MQTLKWPDLGAKWAHGGKDTIVATCVIGLLHLGLEDVLLVIALCGHDLRLGKSGESLCFGLRLGGNDLALGLPSGDLGLGGLLFKDCSAACGLDGGLALLLSGAILRLGLGLHGLHSRLRLIDAGLQRDRM